MSCEQTGTEVGGKSVLLLIGNQNCGTATFAAATDLFTKANHTLVDGETVQFDSVTFDTTGTIPAATTDYFVVNSDQNAGTFQLSATLGGTPIDIDDDGQGELAESFEPFAGIRSKSFTINNELIEITNQDSSEWRKVLDEGGIRSMSITGSGVFNNDRAFSRALQRSLNGKISNYRFVINREGDYLQGFFKITSLGESGEYNAEATYDVSLESSGIIAYTLAP